MEFKSINNLEKWFYKNNGDIVKFHFDLSNCLHLIMEDYLPTRVVLLFLWQKEMFNLQNAISF